jgi:hypothetical protein
MNVPDEHACGLILRAHGDGDEYELDTDLCGPTDSVLRSLN